MKRKPDVILILLVAIFGCITLLAGCATVSPVRIVLNDGAPHYPPADPESVMLLQSEPQRPFETLGQVVLDAGDTLSVPEREKKLRQAAASIGAHAVFITSDMTALKGPVFAYAIRYKD